MPSKSKKQARLMAAAAHNPKFAKKVGVPQRVAKEFNSADAGTGILKGKRKKKAAPKMGRKRSMKDMSVAEIESRYGDKRL